MKLFGPSRAQQRDQNNRVAASLERQAKGEDRNAREHLSWAQSHARQGSAERSASEATIANRSTQKADQLRADAERLRRG